VREPCSRAPRGESAGAGKFSGGFAFVLSASHGSHAGASRAAAVGEQHQAWSSRPGSIGRGDAEEPLPLQSLHSEQPGVPAQAFSHQGSELLPEARWSAGGQPIPRIKFEMASSSGLYNLRIGGTNDDRQTGAFTSNHPGATFSGATSPQESNAIRSGGNIFQSSQ